MGYLVGFAAALGYLLFIPAGRSHLTHVWAEDGARFLVDALAQPMSTNLVTPYAGYLHLVPRLSAQLIALLPLPLASVGLAIVAATLRAGIAVLVFAASGGHIRTAWIRLGLASAVVLLPAGNAETLDNLANLHWFLLFGAFWALLWRPAHRWQNVLTALVLFLAAASSPLVLGLAPLAAARVPLPRWRDRLPTIGFGVGAAAQVTALLGAARLAYSAQPFDPRQGALAGLMRVPLMMFSGPDPVPWLYQRFGYAPALVALAVTLALVGIAVARGRPVGRFLGLAGLVAAASLTAVELIVNWSPVLEVDEPGVVVAGQRYSIAPCLFLLTAVAAGLDALPDRGYPQAAVRLAVPAVIGVAIAWQLQLGSGQLTGPSWRTAVSDATRQCADGRPTATIVHNPPGWFFGLACTTLLTPK
ncbi:MAG TPA: hypothetical protein VH333_13815 [Pseudonocardiaceae bacterium]|nr:hypothetical protein [Pseudonocardiaceae bacterium]